MSKKPMPFQMIKAARWFGIIVRSFVFGVLLPFALLKMVELSFGITVFRYQGF